MRMGIMMAIKTSLAPHKMGAEVEATRTYAATVAAVVVYRLLRRLQRLHHRINSINNIYRRRYVYHTGGHGMSSR
jgi:hypothetical protein